MQQGGESGRRRWVVVAVVVLALAAGLAVGIATVGLGPAAPAGDAASPQSGAATTPDPATDASGAAASGAQAGDPIVERVTVDRVPAQPDRIETRITYEIPENVDSLFFEIARGEYDPVGLDGFERNGSRFEWDGSGDGGTVTIRHDATESFREEPPGRQFVGGTDDWTIVTRPQTRTSYGYSGTDPGVEYGLDVGDEGYAGTRFAFLGPQQAHSRTVDGDRITLVVPEAADPVSAPETILDSVATASEHLRFGDPSEEVVLIAAPTSVEWGPPGLAIGSDARVSADQSVDAPVNVWVHEYVHTRQYRDAATAEGDAIADDAHWLIEGSAEYYAARSSLRAGDIDFETFRNVLARGTTQPSTDAVLADRTTWDTNDAEYEKGALVVGAIDRELRAATNGSVTFQAVMSDWNGAGTFGGADLESFATARGGEELGAFVREHTRTGATPSLWDRATHRQRFESRTARFEYSVVGEPALTVNGPYREGALSEPLVANETVSARVEIENVGQVDGSYRATLVADGQVRNAATGTLDPEETTTVDLAATLESAGPTRIAVGDVARTVEVAEPADPIVTQLSVRPKTPSVGESMGVTATVTNPSGRPADGTVHVTAGNETIATRHVQLVPGENATLEHATSFEAPGTVAVGAGELSVEVGVGETGPIEDALPGVGVGGSLVALVLGTAILARYRPR